MQKLKRKPLLERLGSMLSNLLPPVDKLLTPRAWWPPSPRMIVLIVVCLTLLLMCSGCTATKTVRPMLPPQADARETPQFEGETTRDLLEAYILMREAQMACESDKGVIRRLYKAPSK